MATFVIQINPSLDGTEGFIIYNTLGSPSVEDVTAWAYAGVGQLHKLKLTDEDIVQVDDATDALIPPSSVTGLITELPRRKRTA